LQDIGITIGAEIESSIMTTYGFEAPKEAAAETGGDGLLNEIQGQANTAALIVSLSCKSNVPPRATESADSYISVLQFQYFFIATGCTIIIPVAGKSVSTTVS
ncbi:MAG: hypothetical protein ACRERD_21370, partial [Candidatus Binatia bacterium]